MSSWYPNLASGDPDLDHALKSAYDRIYKLRQVAQSPLPPAQADPSLTSDRHEIAKIIQGYGGPDPTAQPVQQTPIPDAYFWAIRIFDPEGSNLADRPWKAGDANNSVIVWPFILPFPMTVSKLTASRNTAPAGNFTYGQGLYDKNEKLIFQTGAISVLAGAAAAFESRTISPTKTLQPGAYFWAATYNAAAITDIAQWESIDLGSNAWVLMSLGPDCGLAGNSGSTGVMPSTLGGITLLAVSRRPILTLVEAP